MNEERERSQEEASPARDDDATDAATEEKSEVDEQSEESFPASDPPSY